MDYADSTHCLLIVAVSALVYSQWDKVLHTEELAIQYDLI